MYNNNNNKSFLQTTLMVDAKSFWVRLTDGVLVELADAADNNEYQRRKSQREILAILNPCGWYKVPKLRWISGSAVAVDTPTNPRENDLSKFRDLQRINPGSQCVQARLQVWVSVSIN